MKYTTAAEVADKWRISIRRVQFLCAKDMIPGAVKFGKTWAIPVEAQKPQDNRYKVAIERQIHNVQSLQAIFGDEELLIKIIEVFPYPIHISKPDGTVILINESFIKAFHITDKEEFIEKYNMLQDTFITNLGIKEIVKKAFQGETVHLNDIKVPVQDIINKYGTGEVCFNSVFQNITSFPVYNEHNKLSCVVSVFITSKQYCGKEEIVKGKMYIENHWQERFDIAAVARASGFSKTQFTRLFKTLTGITPLNYYLDIKINMLKEKLLDANLSICQAFSACGLDYSGHYAKVFKVRVGTTPSEYRKINI
jgi:AraC-like DNA-binding protein